MIIPSSSSLFVHIVVRAAANHLSTFTLYRERNNRNIQQQLMGVLWISLSEPRVAIRSDLKLTIQNSLWLLSER